MKKLFLILIFCLAVVAVVFCFEPRGWIQDYRVEDVGFNTTEARQTTLINYEETIMMIITVYQGKIIVERFVKDPAMRMYNLPSGWTARNVAYTGDFDGQWNIIHRDIN